MKRERIHFTGARGERLVGYLDRPSGGAPAAVALFAHCFTCSKDLKAVRWISDALVERGLAVLRFDFTGLGESEGDFADTDFRSNLDDLEAAGEWLRENHRPPDLLIGHSLGGAAVLAAAERFAEARAVATIGAPSDTEHLRDTLIREAPELTERDEAEVRLAGRTFKIGRQLVDDLARDHLSRAVAELGKALLIFHSPVDEVVGIDHARRLYEAARHPKSFVTLDDASHLLTREDDARYVGAVLAAWASRYLERTRASERGDTARTPDGQVTVIGAAEGYATRVLARRHELAADEPESIPGGTDTGPSPYEYLLASLGTCTSMTLRMYADRKGWPLEEVTVHLDHDRLHADDCADCTDETRDRARAASKAGKIDILERRIALAGDLDAEQRERLFEIADRCPVHRTLSGEIHIRTEALENEAPEDEAEDA